MRSLGDEVYTDFLYRKFTYLCLGIVAILHEWWFLRFFPLIFYIELLHFALEEY